MEFKTLVEYLQDGSDFEAFKQSGSAMDAAGLRHFNAYSLAAPGYGRRLQAKRHHGPDLPHMLRPAQLDEMSTYKRNRGMLGGKMLKSLKEILKRMALRLGPFSFSCAIISHLSLTKA